MYLESLVNPAKFVAISREVVKHKPVVVMKSGRSTQGALPILPGRAGCAQRQGAPRARGAR